MHRAAFPPPGYSPIAGQGSPAHSRRAERRAALPGHPNSCDYFIFASWPAPPVQIVLGIRCSTGGNGAKGKCGSIWYQYATE